MHHANNVFIFNFREKKTPAAVLHFANIYLFEDDYYDDIKKWLTIYNVNIYK